MNTTNRKVRLSDRVVATKYTCVGMTGVVIDIIQSGRQGSRPFYVVAFDGKTDGPVIKVRSGFEVLDA